MTVTEIVMTAMLSACIGSIIGLKERINGLISDKRDIEIELNHLDKMNIQIWERLWDVEYKLNNKDNTQRDLNRYE